MRISNLWKIVVGMALSLGLFHCSFSPPSAPSWKVELNIPVVNKTYTLKEFIDEVEGIKLDSLEQVYVEFDAPIDTFTAVDQLTLDGMESTFSKKLGTFKVDAPGGRSITVKLGDIWSGAAQLDGFRVPLPAFQFTVPQQNLPPFENLQWVEIDSGYVDLTISNHLPADLGKPIIIELVNSQADTTIADWTFSNFIRVGESQTERLNLSGKRIAGTLGLRVQGASPGSADSVLVRASDYFTIDVNLSEMRVRGGAAKVDPQQISFDDAIQIGDSVVIRSAKIRSGSMVVDIAGNLPVDAQVSFTLPDFVDANGAPLSESFVLLKDQANRLVIDLSGYTFAPVEDDFGAQKVQVQASVLTLQQPNDILQMEASDSVSASFFIDQIYFSEISGRFYQKSIEIPAQSIEVDLPSKIDSVQLEAAQLRLQLLNSIGFPANVHVNIVGRNDRGDEVALTVEQTIQPGGQGGAPELSDIILNEQNSSIVDLLNILPTQLELTGYVDIGRPDWVGTIRETDFVTGTVVFTAPAALQLPEQDFESEVSQVDLDQETRDNIEKHLDEGEFVAQTTSHLPIGAQMYLNFALSDSTVFSNPDLRIGPVSVESGQIDPVSKTVNQPRENTIHISLSREELLLFTNENLYTGVQIHFPGTNGQVVRLLGSDYLNIKAIVRLQVMVDDNNASK